MTHFTITDSGQSPYFQEFKGGGVLLAEIDHDGTVYYQSPGAEFKRKVDEIIAQIRAREEIVKEEERLRDNAELKVKNTNRVAAAERALSEGLGK